MISIETNSWLLLVPFCLIFASCAHTEIPDAETLDGFTAHVYPSPLQITGARKAEATRLGNELGLHLLSATDKAEIGISDQALHLEKTDGVWRFTRIIAGGKTTKLGLDHMLGGSPAITVPLTSLRKGRNRPWEKELILSGQRDGVKLEIVLRVSWRGPFITTDIHLSNEEEIPDLDFWIGFGLKIEGDDPIVHVMAPANLGHEWTAQNMTKDRRFEIDFTVFPGLAVQVPEHNLRMTAAMDYGYTDFTKPLPKMRWNYRKTKHDLVFPRTVWRLPTGELITGYSWRRHSLPPGQRRTRVHWFFDHVSDVPAPAAGHSELVARTYASLYEERLNRARTHDLKELAERFLKRLQAEDCRFEYEGNIGLVEIPTVYPKRKMDIEGHAYFSGILACYAESQYNAYFDRDEWLPDVIWDNLGRTSFKSRGAFSQELLAALQGRGLNARRREVYDKLIASTKRGVRWVHDADAESIPSVIARRPHNHVMRPELIELYNPSVIARKAWIAAQAAQLIPSLNVNVRRACAMIGNGIIASPGGDISAMQARGNCVRGMGAMINTLDQAYLGTGDRKYLDKALHLAGVEISYRQCYDDYHHNHVNKGTLIAPYIDMRGSVRGEDNYNDQHSALENMWIQRWDVLLRRSDDILPLLTTLRYLQNLLPYAFLNNVPKSILPRYSKSEPVDPDVAVEFSPQLGRLGRYTRSAIYQSSVVPHAAIAYAGYRPSHPEVLSYLTGSQTADVRGGYDHVIIWNPVQLDTVTTDITGRYVKIKGLTLKPMQIVRLIVKREKDKTFVFLPGSAKTVELSEKATKDLTGNAWSVAGEQADKVSLKRIPAGQPAVIVIGPESGAKATESLAQLAPEFKPPVANIKQRSPAPGKAYDQLPGSILSTNLHGEPVLTYRTFGMTGFWAEPVGNPNQVMKAAKVRGMEAASEADHTVWLPGRNIGGRHPENYIKRSWTLAVREEYLHAIEENNSIEYRLQTPWPMKRMNIDLDASILGIRDTIEVLYGIGDKFKSIKVFKNKTDYKEAGTALGGGYLHARRVMTCELPAEALAGTKDIVIRIKLSPYPTTKFYNANFTVAGAAPGRIGKK